MPELRIPGAAPVTLHYTDTGGPGRPVVLIHGWPLSGESFAGNIPALVDAGHRVVTYDRRGFGRSGKPAAGHDYDTLAGDLDALMRELDLTGAVLLGFSMGGGEVARYIGVYGQERLAGVVLSGSILPALRITPDNPDGALAGEDLEAMSRECAADHAGFIDQFVTTFFSNAGGLTVEEPVRREALRIGLQSDPDAAARTIVIWGTDLRDDVARFALPTLIIHGEEDRNVPLDKSSRRLHELVPGSTLHVIRGGPHGVNVSHQQEWEGVLLEFLAAL